MNRILQQLGNLDIVPTTKRLLCLALKVIVINIGFIGLFIVLLYIRRIIEQIWIIENARLSVDDIKWHLDRRGVRYNGTANRDNLLEQLKTSGDPLRLAEEKTFHCKSPEDCQKRLLKERKRVWIIKVGNNGCSTDNVLKSWKYILAEARLIGLRTATQPCFTEDTQGFCWFLKDENIFICGPACTLSKPGYCHLLIKSGTQEYTNREGLKNKYQGRQWMYSIISQMGQVDINKQIAFSEAYTVTMFARARLPPLFYRLLSIAYEDKIRFLYFNTNTVNGRTYRKMYTTSELDPLYFVHTPFGDYSHGHLGEQSTFSALYFFLSVVSTVHDENVYWHVFGVCNVVGLTFFFLQKEGRNVPMSVVFIIVSTILGRGIVYVYSWVSSQTALDMYDMHQTNSAIYYWTILNIKSWIDTVLHYLWLQYASCNRYIFCGIYAVYLFGVRKCIATWYPSLMIDLPWLRIPHQQQNETSVPEVRTSMNRAQDRVQIEIGYPPERVVSRTRRSRTLRRSYSEEERGIMLLDLMTLLGTLRNEPRIDVDEVMSNLKTWYHPYESSAGSDHLHHCHDQFLDSTICTICSESYIEEELISGLNCGHTFHLECISEWFKQNRDTCPNCRQQQTLD